MVWGRLHQWLLQLQCAWRGNTNYLLQEQARRVGRPRLPSGYTHNLACESLKLNSSVIVNGGDLTTTASAGQAMEMKAGEGGRE